MPDATITSTASTFGTISGVFSADQSTISGTISGIIPGTLTGSVGVPGPAGPAGIGLPAGGTSGQFLQKTSGVDYATDWVTVNLTGLATESWVTAGFYPLTGNPSSFLTASALTPYLTSATASSTYQTLAGMSAYLTTSAAAAGYYPLSGNPSGFLTAASLSGYATESWVTGQGYITSAALTPYLTSATAASTYQTLSGMSSYLTTATAASTYQTLSGMSDYLSKAGNLAGLASTSTARTNLGLGSLAVVNDAPSDGSQYARKNGAWDVVTATSSYITSVSSPLSVTSGNLTIDLSAYAPLASPAFTGTPTAPTPSPGTDSTQIATTEWVKDFDYAPTNSPHFTGNPQSVTPSTGDNDTSIATTAFVKAQGYITSSALSPYLTTATAATTYATILEPSVDGILTIEPSGVNSATLQVNQDANNYIHLRPWAGQIAIAFGGSVKFLFNDNYLRFSDGSQQTVAYPGPSGFLLKADNLAGLASTSTARTNLGLGTMATATASDYSTTTAANGLYYPLSSNPASYLVAADIAGKAPLASPALTGNVTITSNSTGPALFIEQAGTGNILTLHDQASDTTFVAIDQNGKVNTIPSTTANAGFNVPHGAAPTSPVNGDIWTTTTGLFMRQNGFTKTYANYNDPSVFTNPNQTLGNSTAAGTINVGTGATISGATRTINIGTGSAAGSTNAINIGGGSGASTTTLNGITNGVTQTAGDSSLKLATTAFVTTADNLKANLASPSLTGTPLSTTAAADTNTTQIATTAFVVGQAGSATPLVNGTAAVGTSLRYARQDHVHGTDTTRAPLASPALTGTPTAPTATLGTNTTQIATTAFVLANASSGATWGSITGTLSSQTDLQSALDAKLSTTTAASTYAPLASPTFTGTVTIPAGASISGYATTASLSSYAPLASPALTGTPTAPTAAVDTNTTQVATTAYVVGQGYLKSATASSTYAPLASPALTGTPTAPTATGGTNTTQIATTAFVTAAIPTNNVKAWVNFNGTGTVAIRASMNVSSITDNGTGDYTVNFTTAMTDANYAAAGFAGDAAFSIAVTTSSWGTYTQTTSAFRFKVSYGATTIDTTNVHMTIHR
jgi:hypothetical protein